jgi:putative peptidoglycan lipid II flippase
VRVGGGQAVRLAVISAVGRAPAFLVPVLMGVFRGAGLETDAYFIAYAAVMVVAGTVAQAVEQSIVPFAARSLSQNARASLNALDRLALRTSLVTTLLWVVAAGIVAALVPAQLGDRVIPYMVSLTLLGALWGGAGVFSGALVSQWHIGTATGSMVLRGIGATLGVLVAGETRGLWVVGLGLGLGELARIMWLRQRLWTLVGQGDSEGGASLSGFGRAAVAQTGAGAATSAAPLVERWLATSVGIGAVSHLEYASRLLILPTILFDGGIAPLLLANWSRRVSMGEAPPSRGEVVRPVVKGIVLAAVCAGLTAVSASLLVHILLAHGRFSEDDAVAVSRLLRWLALGFVATMGALLLERWFLAQGRNRLLAFLSVCRATLRLAVAIILLPSLGLLAFAVGLAVAEWSYLALLALCTRFDNVDVSLMPTIRVPERPNAD